MNNTNDKLILLFLTLGLDMSMLYILFNTDTTFMDKAFIYLFLFIHIVFYFALYTYNKLILDICHAFVFIGIYGSVFLTNIYLIALCLLLLISIRLLFLIHDNRCVLETCEYRSYGYFLDNYYDKIQDLFMIILTCKIIYLTQFVSYETTI